MESFWEGFSGVGREEEVKEQDREAKRKGETAEAFAYEKEGDSLYSEMCGGEGVIARSLGGCWHKY